LALRAERLVLQAERQALQAERQALQAERQALLRDPPCSAEAQRPCWPPAVVSRAWLAAPPREPSSLELS
jgi:hypothetical protein